jgi:MscS family membrane protein
MNKAWQMVCVLLLFSRPVIAQIQPKVTVKQLLEQEEQVQQGDQPTAIVERWDELGRETPKGAMSGFLNAVHQFNYEHAQQFLDFRNLPFTVDES